MLMKIRAIHCARLIYRRKSNMLILLSKAATNTQEMIENYTPQYWAPVLTFIVGFLGIVSQVITTYFLERKKLDLELKKTQAKEIYEFYIPLLTKLREWEFYHSILVKYEGFNLFNFSYRDSIDKEKYYLEFKCIYNDLEDILKEHYAFANKKLDLEVNKLREYVWDTKMKWRIGYSGAEVREIDIPGLIKLISKYLEKG